MQFARLPLTQTWNKWSADQQMAPSCAGTLSRPWGLTALLDTRGMFTTWRYRQTAKLLHRALPIRLFDCGQILSKATLRWSRVTQPLLELLHYHSPDNSCSLVLMTSNSRYSRHLTGNSFTALMLIKTGSAHVCSPQTQDLLHPPQTTEQLSFGISRLAN